MSQWMFQYDKNSEQVVPQIVPLNSSSALTQADAVNSKYQGIVDVAGSYLWTHSKVANAGGRDEIPVVILKERELQLNAMIAQAAYAIGTAAQSTTQILNSISPTASQAAHNQVSNILTKVSTLSSMANEDNLTNAFLAKSADALGDDVNFLTKDWLNPYKGLYLTQPTGWTYLLPFFQNKYQSTNSSWGADSSSSGGALLQGISDLAQAGAGLVGMFETIMKPGSFQEKSKYFQFGQDGDSITISFPLINTGEATFDDVVNNWQLIFMLIYQNRPERIDRNVIKPPKIYEVSIPGVRYMPYAYFSNIDIEYKGSRRQMVIPIPYMKPKDSSDKSTGSSGRSTFDVSTIIPEAYQVTLTITGLVADSKNFMYSSIQNWQQIKITDIQKQASGGLA